MVLGIKEDFSSNVSLDSELKSIPASGLYLNSGVHPSVTLENLLAFLPFPERSIMDWNIATAYVPFTESHNVKDLVYQGADLYQSIKAGTGQAPAEVSEYWLKTNMESLKLKSFIEKVKDKVTSELGLTKRLVNSQYLYEDGNTPRTLPGDYAAWVLEPKGSDYVTIRVNEIALQKSGTDPVDLYVINQGALVETLVLTPDNGRLTFTSLDYELSGKGAFYLAIDSTEVISGMSSIDPLKFDGFVAHTAIGYGDQPQSAKYVDNYGGIGIGLNVTAYLDASKYIDGNLSNFGAFVRSTFELMAFQTFLSNPNNRSNRAENIRMADQMLIAEVKDMNADTVVRRYYRERKRALSLLEKTFDTQLHQGDEMVIEVGSI